MGTKTEKLSAAVEDAKTARDAVALAQLPESERTCLNCCDGDTNCAKTRGDADCVDFLEPVELAYSRLGSKIAELEHERDAARGQLGIITIQRDQYANAWRDQRARAEKLEAEQHCCASVEAQLHDAVDRADKAERKLSNLADALYEATITVEDPHEQIARLVKERDELRKAIIEEQESAAKARITARANDERLREYIARLESRITIGGA